MESHMQDLLIYGRFILNDGQSQAPNFHTVWSHTHTPQHTRSTVQRTASSYWVVYININKLRLKMLVCTEGSRRDVRKTGSYIDTYGHVLYIVHNNVHPCTVSCALVFG